jgi:hypothetical protein
MLMSGRAASAEEIEKRQERSPTLGGLHLRSRVINVAGYGKPAANHSMKPT